MAGEVRCDRYYVPGVTVLDLVARTCPVTKAYGDICVRFDPHIGACTVCPFWYGLRIVEGASHHGEARSLKEVSNWLATDAMHAGRAYVVRCLRQESAGLEPGATRKM